MYSHHGVGRVDHLLHAIRILEVGRQGGPFTAPEIDYHRVFVALFGFQIIQGDFCGIQGGLVSALEVTQCVECVLPQLTTGISNLLLHLTFHPTGGGIAEL